jgi:hypothetical protein
MNVKLNPLTAGAFSTPEIGAPLGPLWISAPKELCHCPLQVGEFDRFGEVFSEPRRETPFAILFHAEPAHGDRRQQPPLFSIQALEQMSPRTIR